MGQRPQELKARIESIRELRVMVTTMRALAAGPARQAQEVLAGMREYAERLGDALATALLLVPEGKGTPALAGTRTAPHALIVFCAEHGFAGAFSRRLLDVAMQEAPADHRLFVVGSRGVAIARERRLPVEWSSVMASHLERVPATASLVTDTLYREFLAGRVRGVEMVYARPVSTESTSVERQSLLPLDLKRFPTPRSESRPITYLPTATLLEKIVGEYVFAYVAHAAMESFASENIVRLSMMNVARQHIDDRLAGLASEEQQARQEQITAELLDVITGAEGATDVTSK